MKRTPVKLRNTSLPLSSDVVALGFGFSTAFQVYDRNLPNKVNSLKERNQREIASHRNVYSVLLSLQHVGPLCPQQSLYNRYQKMGKRLQKNVKKQTKQ